MTEIAAYQEYIRCKHNAFCKAVIRYTTIGKIIRLRQKWEREISLDYLTNEKFIQFAEPEPDEEHPLILQLRTLGGDEAQHHLLLTADSGQRLEAAAAGIVKFQIVGSHVLTGQQGLGHAVISAGAGVGRVEVAPADMGVDDQILRLAFNGQIVGGEHLLLDGLQPLLVGIKDQTSGGPERDGQLE